MKSTGVTRDRYLTPEESARYRAIREELDGEKAEILKQLRPVVQEYRNLQSCIASLKKAREVQGLSRDEIARMAGLDPAIVEAIEERREFNPTINILHNYAIAVGRQLTLVLSDAAD